MQDRLLIADDDRELCRLLSDYLAGEGFRVEAVHDGAQALARVTDDPRRPDLLILDVMMPGKDGLTALRELRARHRLPVIVLSARGEPIDRIVGLELGADDYLAKPFLPRELLARVRALLRRTQPLPDEEVLVDTLRLSPGERRAWLGEVELQLTAAEFGLLLALARRAGTPVDKATLTLEGLGRPIERFDRSVDVHVSRLRRKLAETAASAPRIETVRGLGYQLQRVPRLRTGA
ncbi:MAG: response regulator transcription factor [Gammaproteobacteria bacterium]|nr:response regulator transcription factor [Gammaproteobacteria bacterium]